MCILESGSKPEDLEEIHADMGRTHKLLAEVLGQIETQDPSTARQQCQSLRHHVTHHRGQNVPLVLPIR